MLARVGALERDRPPGIRVHRADVDLVAMALGARGPVVADRERQEVEHEVRVRNLIVRADEATSLEVVRRTGPTPQEEPLGADEWAAPELRRRRLHRDRLQALVLDVHLEVVLEVAAYAGNVGDDVDPESLEVGPRPDPGEEQ